MTPTIDILIFIALSEEFDVAMSMLGKDFKPIELKDVALTCFVGRIPSPTMSRDFHIAIVPAGKMGNTRAATVVSASIGHFKPADVVVLGIAGSVSSDLEPGDVFIPDSVNEYLANSATRGEGKTWDFETSGNQFQTSARLLNRFQMFEHTKNEQYAEWQRDTAERRNELIDKPIQDALDLAELPLRAECKLFAGDDLKLASGPAVGKGKAFLEWLKHQVDRKIAALEMESAGVYDAAVIRTPAPRTIAIRGISDYADARKDKIENAAKGRFRKLAAENALSLLLRAIGAGLFRPDTPRTPEGTSTEQSPSESLAKTVFVIGGVTSETKDSEGELPRLHNASLKLGRLIARAGAQLLICSPFPDSVDYYVATGYAEGRARGVIHIHSPSHPKVAEKRNLLVEFLKRNDLMIQDWKYPGPETDEGWQQAWLLSQLQALDKADLVVAIGGKVSRTANTLLHLAEAKRLPVVPFSFLGGAAKRAFDRRDWKRLNPGLDPTVMERDAGVEETISIANQLILDRTIRLFGTSQAPRALFVSFARQDSDTGSAVAVFLKESGFEALTGDTEIRSDQMVSASIEQAILKSDVCIILWSKFYALSPWCYDELALSTSRCSQGLTRVWLLNLEDSAVVPTEARKLPSIAARGSNAAIGAIQELLEHAAREPVPQT